LSETALTNFIDRLSVAVEARAVGSVPVQSGDGKGTQLTQANELLHSATLSGEEPTVCAVEFHSDDEGNRAENYLYAVWKILIPIGMKHVYFLRNQLTPLKQVVRRQRFRRWEFTLRPLLH
jgi:hypothetical protein